MKNILAYLLLLFSGSVFAAEPPRVACWNVNDWGLAHQHELADAGHHVEWTIGVPILIQNANNPKKLERFLEENESHLSRIPAGAPITIRYHNWLSDFTEVKPEDRGPMEDSPLVWRLRDDGSLDSTPVVCPFGPIEAWAAHGKATAESVFLAGIVAKLPNASHILALENNEPTKQEIGALTIPRPRVPGKPVETDEWGNRLRDWRPDLEKINLRAAEYAALHPDANELQVALDRMYRERYEAFTAAFLSNLPEVWRGRVYTGGYADTPIDRLDFDYRNPLLDWGFSPGGMSLYLHHEKSDRIYADKSGSPLTDHRRLRSPLTVALNTAPLHEIVQSLRPGQPNEVSVWLSPTYGRKVGRDEMGRYLTPTDSLGFYRGLVWATRADVFRYFAASQTKLDGVFYDNPSDPPEVRHWTERDFYNSLLEAVDEVHSDAKLSRFYREAKPIFTDDPSFFRWVLPSGPVKNRLLTTDADAPRYDADGKDLWSQKDGQIEHNMFALGWRIGDDPSGPTLIFAYSPTAMRENVTVQVPELGDVLIPEVGPAGVFHFAGAELPDVDPPPVDPPAPPDPPQPPPSGSPAARAAALLRQARELIEKAEAELVE